jgi:hypothetical protein
MGAPAPSGAAPAASPQAPSPAPVKGKTSPLIWIVGAVAGIFVLIGILVVGAGLYIAHKAKVAGFDSELAQKNPALAAAKVMVSLNPDLETVKIDEDRGLLTIRDRKTGKTITMNAEDIKNGKLTFSDESTGEHVTLGTNIEAKLPAWLPSYPGSKPDGSFTSSGNGNEGGTAHFRTSDAGSKVLAFYQENLKSAGFKITSTFSGDSGESRGGIVTAEDAANRRTVMVTVSSASEGTDVALVYGTKN